MAKLGMIKHSKLCLTWCRVLLNPDKRVIHLLFGPKVDRKEPSPPTAIRGGDNRYGSEKTIICHRPLWEPKNFMPD
jgi:hypothetical protein